VIRALLLLAGIAALLAGAPCSASLVPYRDESDLIATTPSTDEGALGAMVNPAQWGLLERPELSGFWTSDVPSGTPRPWGLSMGRGLGLSLKREERLGPAGGGWSHVTDYQIGLGFGSPERAMGLALGFSGAGKTLFDRSNFLTFGSIRRPTRWLSAGSTFRLALDDRDMDGVMDVGIRPLSDPRLLLFASYALSRDRRWGDGDLAGGVAVTPIPGLLASARWEDHDRVQLTLGVAVGRAAFRRGRRWQDDRTIGTHNSVRLSSPQRGFDLDRALQPKRRTMTLDLRGHMVYQSYRYFDQDALPLRDVTGRIQFAADDPTVGGVAVKLSGFEGNLSMAWEVREKLMALRRAGKRVTVVCDNLAMPSLYIASAADRIVMDPRGSMILPGVTASRTYYHDLLGKLGIGFEEWRYYKYKSAMETFSRDRMSEADREQYGAIVRATYDEVARAFTSSGRATRAEFDHVVNEEPYLPASRLLELRWVEALGRWEDLERADAGAPAIHPIGYGALLERRWQPRERWGPDPTIALVYLVGDCAMDEGIRARASAGALRRYRKDPRVKAVVLRVDSPGGDPLASDVVAEQTRKLRQAKKTAVVSQGRVAGSGGYWISMDGEAILTSPFTLTGSIGVIGGWAWNEGFGRKTGLTSDRVQEGKSADLLGGIRIPFLGATLPERNLNEGERRLIGRSFDELYTDFTNKVASARGLAPERVREIAEGHVYDGATAIRLKLADREGTLDEAIAEAKRRAGIGSDEPVRVVEYPKRPLVRLPAFLRPPGVGDGGAGDTPVPGFTLEARALQSVLDRPGRPLLVVPRTFLPDEAEAVR
jgi:protease IV